MRERQAEEISVRDERSNTRRQATISKAERAIDQFYEEYTAKHERQTVKTSTRPMFQSLVTNLSWCHWYRDSEAEYLASLTDSLSPGTTWDRICELVELPNFQSKTLACAGPGTTEVSRYLLRLRREGTSAPGATGY